MCGENGLAKQSLLLVLIKTLLVELLDDAGGDLGETLLRVERQQFPSQVEGVREVAGFVLSLRDELMLELLQELQMVEILLSQRLNQPQITSSPMTAFMAAVSLAAA